MMKSRKNFLKLLFCFSAFFCTYIPTANADIVFKGDTSTGNIVLRYETNKCWSGVQHNFYWNKRNGWRNYDRPHYESRRGYEHRKYDHRQSYKQPKHDHRRENRKHRNRRW